METWTTASLIALCVGGAVAFGLGIWAGLREKYDKG